MQMTPHFLYESPPLCRPWPLLAKDSDQNRQPQWVTPAKPLADLTGCQIVAAYERIRERRRPVFSAFSGKL